MDMGPDTETMIRHAFARHARLQLSELGRLWLSFLALFHSTIAGSFTFSSISRDGSLEILTTLEATTRRFNISFFFFFWRIEGGNRFSFSDHAALSKLSREFECTESTR